MAQKTYHIRQKGHPNTTKKATKLDSMRSQSPQGWPRPPQKTFTLEMTPKWEAKKPKKRPTTHPENRCQKRPPTLLRRGSCQSALCANLGLFPSDCGHLFALVLPLVCVHHNLVFFKRVLARNTIFQTSLAPLLSPLASFFRRCLREGPSYPRGACFGRPKTLTGRKSRPNRRPQCNKTHPENASRKRPSEKAPGTPMEESTGCGASRGPWAQYMNRYIYIYIY